jgi:hypothetical protein
MDWFLLGGLILIAFVAGKALKDKEKKVVVDQPTAPVVIPKIPTGPWAYVDDMVVSLDEETGGDSNAPLDFVLSMATALHFNNLPEFIVVTNTVGGVSDGVCEELLSLMNLDIPVHRGGPSYKGVASPGSFAIALATQRGKFTVVNGGPVQDIAQALKEGAVKDNLAMDALLEGTSNKTRTDESREVAEYVQNQIHVDEVGNPGYKVLLQPVEGPYKDGTAFVDSNRSVKAWDRANSPTMVAQNVRNNRHQKFNTGKLRIADVIATMQYFNVDTSDGNAMFSIMQHGLQIMEARQP